MLIEIAQLGFDGCLVACNTNSYEKAAIKIAITLEKLLQVKPELIPLVN